jgi:hypothetical protein
MSGLLMEQLHLVKGLDPVADAFAGTVYSDIVDISEHNRVMFIVYSGVGTTGTSTLTVESSDDTSGTNVTAIPFYYRQYTVGASDVEGAITRATSSGFLTTAGSGRLICVEVRADEAAATGRKYIRLKAVEGTDSAVLGGILVVLGEPRYRPAVAHAAID